MCQLPPCRPAATCFNCPPTDCPQPPANVQASFLPSLFWLGLPELGRNLVFLVRPAALWLRCAALRCGHAALWSCCKPLLCPAAFSLCSLPLDPTLAHALTTPNLRNCCLQMTLSLYVGNAIKDLVSSPRPLGVPYGRQRLRFLGGSDEETELNAKVDRCSCACLGIGVRGLRSDSVEETQLNAEASCGVCGRVGGLVKAE